MKITEEIKSTKVCHSNMGPDDVSSEGHHSWDGRKTEDFEKVSNDGLWAWDGSSGRHAKKEEFKLQIANKIMRVV